MRRSGLIKKAIATIIIIFTLIITLYPLLWLISGSFKTQQEFYTNIWDFAKNPNIRNYIDAFAHSDMAKKYFNSFKVLALYLCIMLPVVCCAAYVLARMEFRGKKFIYIFLLLGMMVPAGVLSMPTYSVAIKLHLVNSHIGLVLVYAAQAVSFGVFLMRSFYISLPKSLEEAAMVDGCSRLQSLWYIIIPLTKPGIMTLVVFNGLNAWNEYFMAFLILRKKELYTLPIGLKSFIGQYTTNYPQLFAALIMATLPIVIIYLFAQKSFVSGITAGAVKG